MKHFLICIFAICVSSPCLSVYGQTKTEGKLIVDQSVLTLPCPRGVRGCGTGPSKDFIIEVRVPSPSKNSKTKYKYVVTGGQLVGSGSIIHWDLSEVHPGTYQISVTTNGKKPAYFSSTVIVKSDICICDCDCPTLTVLASALEAKRGGTIDFDALVSGGDPTFHWTAMNGEIVSGQGTSAVKIRPIGVGTVEAKVEIGGLDPYCRCTSTASASAVIID